MSADEHDLSELVAAALGAYEDGGEPGFESFCARHPAEAAGLRERIRFLKEAGLFPPAGHVEEPRQVGEYRLIRRLGDGGMGVVYLAEQKSLGRQVAIKMVRPELLFFDNARARFRREVEAIARLQHPGLVAVYQVGEEDGLPYFAMEWIRGLNLSQVLRSLREQGRIRLEASSSLDVLRAAAAGGVAEPRAQSDSSSSDTRSNLYAGSWVEWCIKVIQQVAQAVQHAHDHGVLHRDIKPSNIMLTDRGRVVLLDFGLAAASGADELTRDGAQLGSLPYMAPELLHKGVSAVDARTDVYGLGVTLFELLYLQPAFPGEDGHSLRDRVLKGEVQRVDRSGVSWEAMVVCRKAMDPEPAQRYASAQELADDLRRILDKRPIRGRPPGLALRLRRFVQRRPALVLSIAVLVIAVWGVTVMARTKEKRVAQQIADQQSQELEAILKLDERLRKLPAQDADPLRHEALGRAEKLWGQMRDPGRPRLELGRIYGELLCDTGTYRRGLEVLTDTERACRARLAAAADALEVRLLLAKVLRQQAEVHRIRGEVLRADEILAAAVRALEAHPGDLIADAPQEWIMEGLLEGRLILAQVRNDRAASKPLIESLHGWIERREAHARAQGLDLGRFQVQAMYAAEAKAWEYQGEMDRALELFDRSVPLLEQLYRDKPDNLRVGMHLVARYGRIARIHRGRRAWDQAEVWARRAYQTSGALLQTHMTRPWLVLLHNQDINTLGTILIRTKKLDEARTLVERGLQSAQEMVEHHADSQDQHEVLAMLYDTAGQVATTQQRMPAATEVFRKLVELRRQMLAHSQARHATQDPADVPVPELVFQLARAIRKYCLCLRVQGQLQPRLALAEEAMQLLRELPLQPGDNRHLGAMGNAILMAAELRLRDQDRRERGYELLEQTLESGELHPQVLRASRLYRQLVGTPLFKKLFDRFK